LKEKQIEQLKALRRHGLTYQQTADALGLKLGTVKAYCHRHPEMENQQEEQTKADVCPYCGQLIVNTPKAKRKRFCSDSCRYNWSYRHRMLVNPMVSHFVACICCGTRFSCYLKRSKKYCSHACYIKQRYHSMEMA